MNVHKRCQKNVANNCGINPKELAEILKAMGISGDKLAQPVRIKKPSISESPNKLSQSVTERSHTSPLPTTGLTGIDHNEYGYRFFQDISSRLSFKGDTHREEKEKSLQHIVDRTTFGLEGERGRRKYGLDDFIFIKVLGKGSFGKVSVIILCLL